MLTICELCGGKKTLRNAGLVRGEGRTPDGSPAPDYVTMQTACSNPDCEAYVPEPDEPTP